MESAASWTTKGLWQKAAHPLSGHRQPTPSSASKEHVPRHLHLGARTTSIIKEMHTDFDSVKWFDLAPHPICVENATPLPPLPPRRSERRWQPNQVSAVSLVLQLPRMGNQGGEMRALPVEI